MKRRTTKQLLIILRDYIIETPEITGMCQCINWLYYKNVITEREHRRIDKYFFKFKHTMNYWFPPGEKEPRLKWLNEQILKKPWYKW